MTCLNGGIEGGEKGHKESMDELLGGWLCREMTVGNKYVRICVVLCVLRCGADVYAANEKQNRNSVRARLDSVCAREYTDYVTRMLNVCDDSCLGREQI